ncbi:EVE domain-containing protein [Aliidiomarina indica]|uniref:EVE domain-containing protein n=1 Tax=Aliidiomarina indica TaxID=2749147 RepID=UPI00188F8936|nr:EVE domain-containing protein [Aliidiomarina indica]
MARQYWLMKTEPDECSIDDFAHDPTKAIPWDGVRNYQARNFMREMQHGDQVFIYHSSCKDIGIAGMVEVVKTAYADPSQFDPNSDYVDNKSSKSNPRWSAVDLIFYRKFPRVLSLQAIKGIDAMQENPLIKKGNRLSVIPFTENEWNAILAHI